MEARRVPALPSGKGWQYEPKWDGFRCLAVRAGKKVGLIGRSDKNLARDSSSTASSRPQSATGFRTGERSILKIKRLRTADCVVDGFRYATGHDKGKGRAVGSLLLGLFDSAGKLDHVGFTSDIVEQDRAALTRKLEGLRGGSGFTGKVPGGPSRWSTERSSEWEPLKLRLGPPARSPG